MKRMSNLNVYEARILEIMRQYYAPMNVNSIAYESDIHWLTAQKHLKHLEKKGYVKRVKDQEGNFQWQAKREE